MVRRKMGASIAKDLLSPAFGRSGSQEQLQSLPTAPYTPRDKQNHNHHGDFYISSKEFSLTSTPRGVTNAANEADSESGISSKSSSLFDDSNSQVLSSSAPSTPMLVSHRKAPPKPPRIRSYLEGSPGREMSLSSGHSHHSSPMETLQTSLADVTNTLDRSVAHGPSDGSVVMTKQDPLHMRDKVFQVLVQTREFLFYEIVPENILEYLVKHNVINSRTEKELRRLGTRQAMCEMLLDIITSKGEEEFGIFCDSLRHVEKQDYLADLLVVLDRLIEHVTANTQTFVNRSGSFSAGAIDNPAFIGSSASLSANASSSSSPGRDPTCETCKFMNNNDVDSELLQDSSSFDIEICYFDKELGVMKPLCDVATIKKRGKKLKIEKDTSFLAKIDTDNADKYIPVISLSLYNQCLYKSGIETLAQLLEQHMCIRELSLAKNHIDNRAMSRLGVAMAKNRGLVKVDIRLNTIGDDIAHHLADGIRNNTSLRILNVPSTDLSGTGCNILMDGLTKIYSLTELDVGFNDLGNEGCKGIAQLLSTNVQLRRLRMRDNNITSRGACVVFKALKKNSRLTYLDMSSNRVGDGEGMGTLAQILVHNRTLSEVNLEKCGLSRTGCIALARALRTNTVLRTLELSMNPVGDAGVIALADGLKYNQALETLCLNMCGLGNRGFLTLLDSLRYNGTMTTLKLCYNQIGVPDIEVPGPDAMLEPVQEEAEGNCSLTPPPESMTCMTPPPNGNMCMTPPPIEDISYMHTPPPMENISYMTPPRDGCLSPTPDGAVTPTIEELYDRLCEVLQFNKSLKVLLWGNKLDEPGTISCYPEFQR